MIWAKYKEKLEQALLELDYERTTVSERQTDFRKEKLVYQRIGRPARKKDEESMKIFSG